MIVSVSELRAHVGADASDETFLTVQEEAARAMFQVETGIYLGAPATFTLVLDGTGGAYVDLPQAPRSITSISTRGTGLTWSAVTASDYELVSAGAAIPGASRVLLSGGWGVWPLGTSNVQVVASLGYTQVNELADTPVATDAPAIFKDFVRAFVRRRFINRGFKRPGPSSQKGPTDSGFSEDEERVLSLFRPVLVA